MKRFLPLLALLLGAGYLVAPLLSRGPASPFDLEAFGRLPVLVNGRLKPMDTVARTTLLMFQGRQRVVNPAGDVIPPVAWLLDVLLRPELADRYRHFEVVHPDVLALLKLTTEDGDRKKRFSYSQISPQIAELERQAQLASQTDAAVRTPFQRDLVKLRQNLILYNRLKLSLVPPESREVLKDLLAFQNGLEAGVTALRAREAKQPYDEAAANATLAAGQRFEFMANMGYLLAVPPPPTEADANAWKTVGGALLDTFRTGSVSPTVMAFAGMAETWRMNQPEQFNTLVGLYRNTIEGRYGQRLGKSDLETRFNAAHVFYSSLVLYLVAFLLAVFSWLAWPQVLGRSGFHLMALAWLATTAGIAIRMWLEGRPPVTNLYSSALFVGWGSVGLCLILEAVYRNALGTAAGGMVGFCTLVIAHYLSLSGDTLEMMRAVLDSNFWLATHVVVVTIGYSATYLAGFLGILYVLRGVFTRSLDKATSDALNRMVYGIICFGTLFSLVGTVLGGIWADQSWGRFWGWDPKENGALIIVLWNGLILHARWGGMIRTRGLMALAIFGNIVTSWSWFGTNMLGVGLHSYGFMDAAFYSLLGFALSQLALIALANVPTEKWRSRSALGI
jgi:ABC-type transport system involved in cytochrome c biogenesis permease subunit